MNPILKGYQDLQDAGPFPTPSRFVFTHLNLNPRNIILGDDGQVWLVDFGLSGFYPEWFEYTAMTQWEALGWLGKLARGIIAGFHGRRTRFFTHITFALHRGYLM